MSEEEKLLPTERINHRRAGRISNQLYVRELTSRFEAVLACKVPDRNELLQVKRLARLVKDMEKALE
jgi:hypothetical protein